MFLTILTSIIVSSIICTIAWNFDKFRTVVPYFLRNTIAGPLATRLLAKKCPSGRPIVGDIYTRPSPIITPIEYPKKDSLEVCHGISSVTSLWAAEPQISDFSGMRGSILGMMNGKVPKKDDFEELFDALEDISGNKILFINHRSAKNSTFGIDISFLSSEPTLSRKDAVKVIDILRDMSEEQGLDIILNTTGGCMTAAEIIINALRHHKGKIRVFIPHYALSAGFLVALAADEIHLGKNAFISPIDPQFKWGISSSSITRYATAYSDTATGWVGDIVKLVSGEARAANIRIVNLLQTMLGDKYSEEEIDAIAEEWASGKYNHDKPFFIDDISSLLKDVYGEIPDEIFELYKLHNEGKK